MKLSHLVTCFAVIALSLCPIYSAPARLIGYISYDELFEKSNLIVIAQPTTKTADTEEKAFFPGVTLISGTNEHQMESPSPAVGVETKFNVIKIVKGDTDIKQFVLHHYREASPESDGILTVSFNPSDLKQRYDILLFLVREKDGRYAPYGGQTDPAGRSIFALVEPSR